MLEPARRHAPAAQDIRTLVLPGDPLPQADAVVSVGYVLNYLPDESAIDQALTAIARVPALLAAEGVQVQVASAFGTEQLPAGLCADRAARRLSGHAAPGPGVPPAARASIALSSRDTSRCVSVHCDRGRRPPGASSFETLEGRASQ
jgi:hypothetical protein